MIRKLIKWISIENLFPSDKQRKNSLNYFWKKGQLATLIILLIVAVFIFTLIVMNVGEIANRVSQMSIAADTAGLYLGSQLATKVYILGEAIGSEGNPKTKKCAKRSFWSIVLGFAGAIVGLFTGQWYLVIGLAALGGAIGGLIDYGSFKGVVMGAIQGAMIGLAVLGGAQMMAGEGLASTSIGQQMASIFKWAVKGIGKILNIAVTAPAELGTAVVTNAGIKLGGVLAGVISAGSALYVENVRFNKVLAQMGKFAEALSGLPNYVGTREGIYLQAMSMLVDDPNSTDPTGCVTCNEGLTTEIQVCGGDPQDIDGDGKVSEKQGCFDYWWKAHIDEIKAEIEEAEKAAKDAVNDFINGPANDFINQAQEFLPELDRKEVECGECCVGCSVPPAPADVEGPIIDTLRTIETECMQPLTYWAPGPQLLEGQEGNPDSLWWWYVNDCEHCEPPEGFDEYDYDRYIYEEFIDYIWWLQSKGLDSLINEPETWLYMLYDKDSDSDTKGFYTLFSEIYSKIPDIYDEIKDVRDNLPGCQIALNTSGETIKELTESSPTCHEYDNPSEDFVRPCNWEKEDKPLGIYYALNPSCKIDDDDEHSLNMEIDNIRTIANNLYADLRAAFSGSCSAGEGCSCSVKNVKVIIEGIKHSGITHESCGAPLRQDLGIYSGQKGALTVRYHYTYDCECECCSDSTDPDTGEVTTVCNTTTSHRTTSSKTKTYVTNAPDIFLDEQYYSYDDFVDYLNGMNSFISGLPSCGAWDSTYATTDRNLNNNDDEFCRILTALTDQSQKIEDLLNAIEAFVEDFETKLDDMNDGNDNGAGSAFYEWEDYRGEKVKTRHKITVETGPFKFARIKKTKKCVKLKDYCDNISGCNDVGDENKSETWVKITREDYPVDDAGNRIDRQVGQLGVWDKNIQGKTTKTSHVYYSLKKLGIKYTEKDMP